MPPRWRRWDFEKRDEWLALYVLEEVEETSSPGPLRTLGAALQKVCACKLRTTWKVLDAWAVLHPSVQASAMPRSVVHAYSFALVMLGEPQIATVLMLCFYGVLRISEALKLLWSDVFWQQGAITLYLGVTKRGVDETVVIENRTFARWFKAYARAHPPRYKRQPLCPCSYARVSTWLQKLGKFFRLDELAFTTHSLRRGGATQLLINRMPLEHIMLYGRWTSPSSCKEYLRKGQVFLMRVHSLAKRGRWQLIDLFCTHSLLCWRLVRLHE